METEAAIDAPAEWVQKFRLHKAKQVVSVGGGQSAGQAAQAVQAGLEGG